MRKSITAARVITIIAMMFLIATTYYLRSGILAMVNHQIDAQSATAQERLDNFADTAEFRQAEYEAGISRFDVAMSKYKELIELYASDFDAYQIKIGEEANTMPPPLPHRPYRPRKPEVADELAKINEAFRAERESYFSTARALNPVVALAAVALVGSLLYLILFDTNNARILYVILLTLSFIFIIGPAFHSILSIAAYNLRPPVY